MAFFRQLRLLLWKNGLSALRQPLWSLTVVAWPLIVFLILLVTRHQFPPILRETCYVSPRNLPSAGFFPFLQTLMCNTDSKCRNTSSLVDPTDSKTFANTRSSLLQRSTPLVNLLQGGNFFNFPQNEHGMDHTQVASILNRVFGSTFPDSFNNISLGNDNDTFLGNQEIRNYSSSSVSLVKKALCTITLPMINSTSSHPLSYAVATFCSSNTSVFEVSLLTLNQILTKLMLTKPNETVSAAEASVSVFDQLQNDTSLWESLLQVPQLFSSSSDQVLNNTEFLLSNLQGAVNAIQNTFPVGNDSLSSIHPLLVGSINVIHYVKNWPGKGVSIPLGQIVTLQNDSLSVMVKAVLQEVQIPLDKAIGLTLDKSIVHSYLCDNSSTSLLLTAACATGTVNMVLDWISPSMVAQQTLLAWSKDVAPHDVSFIKAMLQSLTGGLSPGGQRSSSNARRRRSIDTQPQNIEEELFLSVGEVLMEILQVVPEVDAVVQSILTTGFQSMKTVTQALNTVTEIISNGLKDADQLQLTYVELMTNETQASIWIDRVLDSVTRTVIKTLESESLICEDLLSPFEWLLDTESVTADVWKSVICQNSTLQQALLADWQPLVQETQDMYNTVTGKEDINVTLPSILAEWQKLANSTLRIQKVFETLITNLDGEYWTNWILDNSTVDVYDTLLQSFGLFVETFGENVETSELWPDVKNYFHTAYWILSYTPGVTAPPANCSVNYTSAIHCDTALNWPHLTEVVRAALLSPDKALVNSIKGALNLLQYVYADVYKNLPASFLRQELDDEGALSAFMGNLTHKLDHVFQNIFTLPPSKIANPDIILPLLHNLLEPMGLSPLLTPLLSNSSVNVSTVLDVASKLGRFYQPICTSNETDPTMLDFEQLIKQFLSLEGNLTLPISYAMGYSLLNYSEYFSLDDVISLTKAIQPFTNQSNQTSGLVETVLSAIELWKRVMDSPNNDPAFISLAYIQQLRELATSLFRLQSVECYTSSSGQRTKTQINQISGDVINFLSPEMLKNLTDVGPEAALSIVMQMFIGFLPLEAQQRISPLFQVFRDFVSPITECATSQNCSTQVSEIFSFLNQIVEMMSPANANVTHEMLGNNTILEETKFDKVASMFFSFILSHSDEANMRTANQTLQFVRMIMAQPNISVSEIQNALEQSNLTLEELENIAAIAQDVNISNLLDGLMEICNGRKCFEPQQDSMVTAKCVVELIDAISSFLSQLPGFCNETAILLNIPFVMNNTTGDIIQDNSSSSPNLALMHTLDSTLASIRMNLQLNQLNTLEIMRDLDVVEGLIQLFASMEEPFNSTSMMDPFDAQKVYLELVEWYLKRLESITSNSSISELIHPFFYITQMQITLQLAQMDFSSYVSNQYKVLMNSLQYPLDDAGISKIGETVVDVLRHLFDLITFDLEVQNASLPSDLFNTTILNATVLQINQYLDLIEKWMTQPNVSLALTGLLHWGNSPMNVSTQMPDIGLLLESLGNFDLDDELTYLSVINNITQCLRNASMLAEVSGGLQSDDFLNALLDAVKYVMEAWTGGTEDLPVSTQEDILDIVRDTVQVIVQPGVSFASPRNISLLILKTTETIIQYTAPDTFSNYIMYGLEVAITYFESASTSDVPDDWSEMILNEMKTVQGFLPPNSPAQACISVLINITYSFLESYPDNMSIWSNFENATQGNMSRILDQMINLWPSVMDGPGTFGIKASSLRIFAELPSVLEMVMTEKADDDTWENLEEMLESLLSTLDGTELWGNISSAIPQFEIMIGTLVNIEQTQNEMILSLQTPLLTLMEEVAQSANNTHLNLSDISDGMQLAIQNMANGTLACDEVLTDWEPVREAAGLSHAAMAMWCNISLQPALDALTAAQTVYSGLNMSNTGGRPVNASDAAARIVIIVQSLYQVSVNQRLVTVQLIWAFSNQLSVLASQTLSPEAQLYWNQQLQDMNFLDSLSSTNFQLPDEVLNMEPFIIPFIRAIGKALDYTLNNYFTTQNRSTSDKLFEEAAMMFVTSVNTTLDNLLSMLGGNLTGLNESTIIDMAWEAVNLLKHWQVFKKDPTIYQTLQQFLESDSKREILEKVAEIFSWLAAIESNMTSDNIFSTILGNWSRLNDTSFNNMMREAVNLLSEHKIFGDEPMVYEALEHFLESNDKGVTLQKVSELTAWMGCIDANITSNFSMIWGNWSGLNDTFFTNMMWEGVKLFSDKEIFGDEHMIYQALEQFLESNDRSVILQKITEINTCLSYIEANITSDNIFATIWGNWSGLNETSFATMIREAEGLLNEHRLFRDEPMIYQALEQFVASSNKTVVLQKVSEFAAWLASIEGNCTSNNISMIWGNWCGLNETTFTKMMREVVNLLIDHKIFGDEPMIYEALWQFLESNNKREILETVAEICTNLAFTEANITMDNIFSMIWGNCSRLNDTSFTNMMMETVKVLRDQGTFGDEPMIYQALEQFLLFNDKSVILQTVAEIRLWLASIEGNITSNNIFSMIWGNWSGLNETSFTNIKREAVKLLSEYEIFGDEPMIYQALEQFVVSSNQSVVLQKVSEFTAWLASIEGNSTSNNFSMIWGNWSGLTETPFTELMREVVNLLSDQQIFGDEPMIYEALEQFLECKKKREILQTAAEICTWFAFNDTNITPNNISMIWGNWSGLNDTSFTNMMMEAVKFLSEQQIFGVEPSIYQILEQLLTSNRSLLVQKGEEVGAWLTSTDANITSNIIFSIMWRELSELTGTRFSDMTKKAVKLMSDLQIFGDKPIIYEDLDQFLTSSNTSFMVNTIVEFVHAWLPFSEGNSSSDIYSMLWGGFSTLNETWFTNMTWEAVQLMRDLQIFGDTPMVYQILVSNDTSYIVQKVAEMSAWWVATEASGLELLTQALPRIYDIVKPLFSVLKQTSVDEQGDVELFEELAENVLTMLMLLGSNNDLLLPMDQYQDVYQQEGISNYTTLKQRRREATMISALTMEPMDDFIDLFSINYPAMFQAIAVPPTTEDVMETVHLFFNNPNLNVVLKGASVDVPWGLNASREETIDAALGMLSSLTLPDTSQMPFMSILTNAVDMLPDGFPFSSLLKNITRALANEYQETFNLTDLIIQTISELPQMNMTDPEFTEQLGMLVSQVCDLESTDTVHLLMSSLSMEPGQLCDTFLPSLEILLYSVIMNMTSLTESIVQAVIGDPSTYNIQPTWVSVLSETWGFNISSLSDSFNISISPGKVTVGQLLRNKTAFVLEVEQRMNFDPAVLSQLMNTPLPNKNVEILSWLVNLRHCGSTPNTSDIILQTFCSLSVEQWYTFSLLMARYIDTERVFYRVALSEELQRILDVMLKMVESLADMMEKILPAIGQLQNFMMNIQDLNLMANNEFKQMTRGRRSISSQATFATLSRAMCSNNMKSLFDIIKPITGTESTYLTDQNRKDLMNRFNIPRNATPFCTNLYLDMVSTTEGAVAWAFLKPMLMGQILFTPDTPVTRSLMEKANATLQEFANLRKNSEDWIKASNYIFESSAQLSSTLPMLQNSLANSFVKSFIEMHTDIDVDRMKERLSTFSNMTLMLETNKYMVKQITTLSNLMVDLSSCVTFDRYRGFDSADELNTLAQELAKTRDLYASVIFKLPIDQNSSTSRPSRSLSTSSTSSLPPRVSYTIRMHMDNAMRTDRVREPFYVKDTYIVARRNMRYNRGFLYLQESIDRAIIEAQVGQRVTEPAVQLQPFPYPCFQRDEFLQAMSYVFPVMLMIAWVLFVADFVRKLVQERELRLHEYMKMMGVNPLSHFFAWFLESVAQLLITTFILTLILKYGKILPNSDGFLLFLCLCDYGLSLIAFSYLVSSFFDKTYIASLSACLLYILFFFPYILVIALETNLTLSQKSALGLFAPTCFGYASQYVSRYEAQGEGIQWSNAYMSPVFGDTASFGWLCWVMLIDSIIYFIIGGYIRMVFPGKYGIPAPWYFLFTASFWSNLCCSAKSESKVGKGLLITNILQRGQYAFDDDKGKGESTLSTQAGEDYSQLPVGVSLHGLSKLYGNRAAIENLNVSFYEGHVTSLLGHNGAGKTTTMSLLTGLFPPSSGTIEVYSRDMKANVDDVRKELGVCMQYDVLFNHLTTKEHLLLYAQIKAPHWSPGELREQVRSILEETGMYAHRHKLAGTLSGGMRRKLSISIAFIGGSRLVVLDEPTTGVDPCSRRSIWDIVIQNKRHRTIIMSTHHLDEAEVLSDRIAFLERGGLKCCGSPFYLKDKLGQGYKLILTKKPQMENTDSEPIDNAKLKSFVQAHVPEARLKETQGNDLVYSLPPFTSSNSSSYRSLLTALDSNLDALQLGGYGISDTTLEEVFLQLTREGAVAEGGALSISETLSDTASIDSFSSDLSDTVSNFSDRIKLSGSSTVQGLSLAWQQMTAMLIKRFHHSRRDWKGLIAQILLPVVFMVFAMGLGSIRSDLKSFPDLELSPALYNIGPSYSFFRTLNPNSSQLADTMTSSPGMDNACLDNPENSLCQRNTKNWTSSGNRSKPFQICKCTRVEQFCDGDSSRVPHKQIPSSQIVYNISRYNVETYLLATTNEFIRNRYGGFDFGLPLPSDLQMDLLPVPKNRTLSKVWYNPEGHHTMPAYLNSLSNFILRSNLPADKDPRTYAISVSSHPYFGREDDEDIVMQGMLQVLVAVCVLTGYTITTTSFAIYEVKEHHSGSKRLQHIAGISEPFYWTVNFLYDMLVYMIPVTLTLGVIAAFQNPAFTDRLNLAAIALLLVLFGFATFPWMYLLSGVFKDPEMAFITYVCINLFISINTFMSSSILNFLSQITTRNPQALKDLCDKLSQAFLIFPQFNFGNGLMELARMNIQVQILSGYGIDAYKNPFSTDCLGWMFIASFIEGVVFFTLRLLLNKTLIRKVRNLICAKRAVPLMPTEGEDDKDVATEHLRVSSGAASSDILQVNKLTKVYQHLKKKVFAVKSISVGIPAGECFGLLGVNGAGKTTTFKMLTGDVSPTGGTAQIKDWDGRLVDIMECRNKGINIGYCPQVDALDSLLTGEEHLYFYARIRGISKKETAGVVNCLLTRLELNGHRKSISDSYSCGTRRKLSTALALIGHPQILLLDEPSSGMDPRTKRHLWKIISEEVKGKCAVVLTSHSMEECEALCSRLAIMVKGQFRCLGSLQHIKNRFGSGFTVKMYLAKASSDAAAITGFMQRQFPSTYLKDKHSNMVEYHIPSAPGGVADIFDQLESNKNALQIKHFSVSQTTLDEVFINFATEKIDMENVSVQSEDESEDLDSIKGVEKLS